MDSNEKLKIMQWNAQGITTHSSIQQLQLFLDQEGIHIAFLVETFLKSHHKIFLSGYKVYRRDRDSVHGGGVAIAVKSTIHHSLVNPCITRGIENISIETSINGRKLLFTAAYNPRFGDSFVGDMKLLTPVNREYFVFGDFNAKHGLWNCNRSNAAGRALYDLQMSSAFVIHHSDSPTHFPHSGMTPSTIDFLISNSSLFVSPLTAHDDQLMSDHAPVTCTLDAGALNLKSAKYLDFKKANWLLFRKHVDENIDLVNTLNSTTPTSAEIDEVITCLKSTIMTARDKSVPLMDRRLGTMELSSVTRACITYRNTLRRKWQRCSDIELKRTLKSLLNSANCLVKENVNKDRNDHWSGLLKKIKTGDKNVWRITKNIRGGYSRNVGNLHDNGAVLYTDTERAEAIATSFARAHMLTKEFKHSVDVRVRRFNKLLERDTDVNLDATTFVTPSEIKNIIRRLKPSKAPGADGIQNVVLKKLPDRAIVLMTKIFNACIKIGYFRKEFKLGKVIPILKRGKDPKLSTSYRPISLLSCLGKIFERVIQAKLSTFVHANNIIAPEQFGFRPGHSTVHQVQRVCNIVKNNRRNRRSTGLVLLDIEKAFDSVWHEGLVYKLETLGIPKFLLKIIKSFVHGRQFFVSLNGKSSDLRDIPAGVPQGSVLSPLLYALYISDFKRPKHCKVAFYADDTALMVDGKLTQSIIRKLQKGLRTCDKYLRKWKIQLNASKSQAMIFPFNKSAKRNPAAGLLFQDGVIDFSNDVTYLGITLDKKLNFSRHVANTAVGALRSTRALYPLLNGRSKLSLENKGLLYRFRFRFQIFITFFLKLL